MKLYNPFKRIKELIEDNRGLANECMRLSEEYAKKLKAEEVMMMVLGRGINWYDYKELGFADHVAYWNDVQSILKNNALMNEYNHFVAELIKEMAKDMNIEQIKYARFGVVALESFLQHLKEINNPDTNETTNEIHESI